VHHQQSSSKSASNEAHQHSLEAKRCGNATILLSGSFRSNNTQGPMTWIECAVIVLAGTGAGIINTVAGSGTLITFPVLLWAGLPPVAANVANNIGLRRGR